MKVPPILRRMQAGIMRILLFVVSVPERWMPVELPQSLQRRSFGHDASDIHALHVVRLQQAPRIQLGMMGQAFLLHLLFIRRAIPSQFSVSRLLVSITWSIRTLA